MIIKKLAAGALAAVSVALVAPATAQAEDLTAFEHCWSSCDSAGTFGTIDWHNRTATVHGWVVDRKAGWTQAKFVAYKNGRPDGDLVTRTTDDKGQYGPEREFSFVIGDTNRPGGLERVAINLCFDDGRCKGWTDVRRPS